MATQTASPSSGRHSRLWLTIGLVLLVVVAWLAWAPLRRWIAPPPAAPRAQAAVPATTVRVASETVPLARTGVGSVLPVASVTVRTRIDGQLDRVDFKEGQDVKAGQLLARIDPRTFQAQLQQIEAQKSKDEAQLANARADLARYTDLIKEDATSQQTLDTQRALVNQLQATVKTDDAQVNYARVQLGFTSIAAPIAGRIGARLVDPGNIVHATDTSGLLVINQIDPIAVQFTLPDSAFQAVNKALRPGSAPLKVQAIDRQTHELLGSGDLVLLNNQIDSTTGTIALKAHFANPGHTLWPGQSVDARITLGEQADALTVPSAVVQRSQDGYFAYVVDADDKVRVQPVEVAGTDRGKTVIAKGLAAGDRVVLDGQYRLTPGARISEGKGGAKGMEQASASAAPGGAGARP